jgi:hypothetical protein
MALATPPYDIIPYFCLFVKRELMQSYVVLQDFRQETSRAAIGASGRPSAGPGVLDTFKRRQRFSSTPAHSSPLGRATVAINAASIRGMAALKDRPQEANAPSPVQLADAIGRLSLSLLVQSLHNWHDVLCIKGRIDLVL